MMLNLYWSHEVEPNESMHVYRSRFCLLFSRARSAFGHKNIFNFNFQFASRFRKWVNIWMCCFSDFCIIAHAISHLRWSFIGPISSWLAFNAASNFNFPIDERAQLVGWLFDSIDPIFVPQNFSKLRRSQCDKSPTTGCCFIRVGNKSWFLQSVGDGKWNFRSRVDVRRSWKTCWLIARVSYSFWASLDETIRFEICRRLESVTKRRINEKWR